MLLKYIINVTKIYEIISLVCFFFNYRKMTNITGFHKFINLQIKYFIAQQNIEGFNRKIINILKSVKRDFPSYSGNLRGHGKKNGIITDGMMAKIPCHEILLYNKIF